jgi:hypothetical protein
MVKLAVLGGFELCNCPSYSFLIEHQSGRKLLFNLGVRKDWENQALSVVELIKDAKCGMRVDKDVYDILADNGHDPKADEAIFWSRKLALLPSRHVICHATRLDYHWDHTGNPARFLGSIALIVGPGFKGRFRPASLTVEDSPLKDDMW